MRNLTRVAFAIHTYTHTRMYVIRKRLKKRENQNLNKRINLKKFS
jgi:hypothetical protein